MTEPVERRESDEEGSGSAAELRGPLVAAVAASWATARLS